MNRSARKAEMKTKLVWYARGGHIAKCGPFDSQVEAVAAMRLTASQAPKLSPVADVGDGGSGRRMEAAEGVEAVRAETISVAK
jgi:hypothetical protein